MKKPRRLPHVQAIVAAALQDRRLSHPEIRVFVALASFVNPERDDNACWPSQAELAERAGFRSRGTVVKALPRLAAFGYCAPTPRRRNDGGATSTLYRLTLPEAQQTLPFDVPAAVPPASAGRSDAASATQPQRPAPQRPAPEPPPESPAIHPLNRPRFTPLNQCDSPIEEIPNSEVPKDVVTGARAGWHVTDLDLLERRLFEAAGAALDPQAAATGLRHLGEPLSWLGAGCDLALDVVPTVALLAARAEAPVRSWRYFRAAVLRARADRTRAHPAPADPAARFEEDRNAQPDRDRQPETRAQRLLRFARADALRRKDR